MSQQELLKRTVECLADLGIEYMITGSITSSLQGEPRSTHDIDIIVAIPPSAVKALVHAFPPPDYYLSEASIQDALRHQSMFNLVSILDTDKLESPRTGSREAPPHER